MNPETRLFIDGELVAAASGSTYPNISPVSEAVIGYAADAGPEDMDRAIAAARRAFDHTDWSTNHAFRLHCIGQLRDALVQVREEFRQQIAAETGSPLGICGAMGPQCDVPIGFIDYALQA
ncbi:MAG: aldehyde dehydrogenase family protein, partial [Pseudomonadales bacterium]|nr:aldehyde dehydrogenase family protein [Pseudomonadales bacterium]